MSTRDPRLRACVSGILHLYLVIPSKSPTPRPILHGPAPGLGRRADTVILRSATPLETILDAPGLLPWTPQRRWGGAPGGRSGGPADGEAACRHYPASRPVRAGDGATAVTDITASCAQSGWEVWEEAMTPSTATIVTPRTTIVTAEPGRRPNASLIGVTAACVFGTPSPASPTGYPLMGCGQKWASPPGASHVPGRSLIGVGGPPHLRGLLRREMSGGGGLRLREGKTSPPISHRITSGPLAPRKIANDPVPVARRSSSQFQGCTPRSALLTSGCV